MKVWKEYCNILSQYYEWYPKDRNMDANLISYNSEGFDLDKITFFDYCSRQMKEDLIDDSQLYLYMVAIEEVKDRKSKLERFKKCWRKLSDCFDVSFLTLGTEEDMVINNKLYFSAIAKTELYNLDKVLNILDAKRKYEMFISKNDYIREVADNKYSVSDFVFLDSTYEIDFVKMIEVCSNNHDLICRYGADSVGVELAIIYNVQDREKYIK